MDWHLDWIKEVCEAIGMKMLIAVPSFNVGLDKSVSDIKKEAAARLRYIAEKWVRTSAYLWSSAACRHVL